MGIERRKIGILGTAFNSFSLREENSGVLPNHIEWLSNGYASPYFYWDGAIKTRPSDSVLPMAKTAALLVEPICLRPENYQDAVAYQYHFDYIFTYDRKTIEQLDPAKRRFYILGGSSIAFYKWQRHPKSKDVCMFFSGKDSTEGHALRRKVMLKLKDKIDIYGAGVNRPVDSKFEVLKDYRYCIVVESCSADYYFTEKIIDPISVGTIPVYWGCPSIAKFFNETGITPLEWILEDGGFEYWLTKERHDNLLTNGILHKNLEKAGGYAICEDWMYNTYPEIFNG